MDGDDEIPSATSMSFLFISCFAFLSKSSGRPDCIWSQRASLVSLRDISEAARVRKSSTALGFFWKSFLTKAKNSVIGALILSLA